MDGKLSRKNLRSARNPLCLSCFREMVPRGTEDGLVCFDAKTGEPHTCDRYLEGKYRPAGNALKRHRRRLGALEDDPRQIDPPGLDFG